MADAELFGGITPKIDAFFAVKDPAPYLLRKQERLTNWFRRLHMHAKGGKMKTKLKIEKGILKSALHNRFIRNSFAVAKHWQNGFCICRKEIRDFTAQDFGEHHDLSIVHPAYTGFDFG